MGDTPIGTPASPGATRPRPDRVQEGPARPRRERLDVLVIGAGQAGLSVGHQLAGRGLRFAILDAGARVGDQWRKRWDSLRLFTPARFDGLAGMPFPTSGDYFPTKDEMGDYLEAYAARFQLPVRTGRRVRRVWQQDGRYVVEVGSEELEADQVVVAMATYQSPRVPEFAGLLDPDILQLHSSGYRRPQQLRPGGVLIVGAGNSGAEIALDVARGHPVWLAGRPTGHIPFRMDSFVGLKLLCPFMLKVVFHHILTIETFIGRRARPRIVTRGGPLIRVKPAQLEAAGVQRVARIESVRDGLPVSADGQVVPVTNIIWCTGYRPGFSWIDLPVMGDGGEPQHEGGACPGQPGLYFVGLNFLHAMSSTMIHGAPRDAARIVDAVVARARATAPAGAARPPVEVAAANGHP